MAIDSAWPRSWFHQFDSKPASSGALADQSPQAARAWLASAPDKALFELAAEELRSHYGPLEMWRRTRAVEISLRGHGMAVPACGSLANPGLAALREADGRLLFAHSDLSG